MSLLIFVILCASCSIYISNSEKVCGQSRVIAFVFAGREKYLSIQLPYFRKLIERGALDEVHYWQYTKKEDDVQYLESISNLHKTSRNFHEYREIFPLIEGNLFSLDVKAEKDAHVLLNGKYEIVIGGFENTKTIVRRLVEDNNEEHFTKIGDVLDPTRYKKFVVKLENNTLSINDFFGLRVNDSKISSVKIHSGNGSEVFWDYEEAKNKNFKLFDTEWRELWNELTRGKWGEAYSYYLNYSFDVLLKLDDDIIYMDLERYEEYINYIKSDPNKICVFPNLINQDVSLFYNIKHGLVPEALLGPEYVNKSHRDFHHMYHEDGPKALKVHEFFLNNVDLFIKNKVGPIKLDGHKERISMFGILKKNYNRAFDRDMNGKIDESYVYHLKGNVLYPRFVACHYQHWRQVASGLDDRFLQEYRRLSKR